MIDVSDIRTVLIALPSSVKAYTVKDADGFFTIVLNCNLSYEQNVQSYLHELKHISGKHFDLVDCPVDVIESIAHRKEVKEHA